MLRINAIADSAAAKAACIFCLTEALERVCSSQATTQAGIYAGSGGRDQRYQLGSWLRRVQFGKCVPGQERRWRAASEAEKALPCESWLLRRNPQGQPREGKASLYPPARSRGLLASATGEPRSSTSRWQSTEQPRREPSVGHAPRERPRHDSSWPLAHRDKRGDIQALRDRRPRYPLSARPWGLLLFDLKGLPGLGFGDHSDPRWGLLGSSPRAKSRGGDQC